ncbi:hypothetical protein ABMA28_015078 [Loxostege sticticalis]|uniref:Uncharacterized protein n=1 Tax=Loxostege sticticalis TaxID=481309 RepID=A0ABD0TE99_LOXSC
MAVLDFKSITFKNGKKTRLYGTLRARVRLALGRVFLNSFILKRLWKSTSGINEEIIWISISMAIAIAVLIAIALCYILKEKCSKRQAYREQS